MLANKEFFDSIEKVLRENGTLDKFESEHGKIKRRVLITNAKIPEDEQMRYGNNGYLRAYTMTFDPGRAAIYAVIDTKAKELYTNPMAIGPKDKINPPDNTIIEHVLNIIMEQIDDPDKIDDAPMCAFINDESDVTVTLTGDIAEDQE